MTRLFVTSLLIAAVGCTAWALPDLVVDEITTTPRGVFEGDLVRLSARVRNDGDTTVTSPFHVAFRIDGKKIASPTVPGGLAAGGFATVTTFWTAVVGTHTVTATADDPLNRVEESSEVNNRESIRIVISVDPTTGANLALLKVAVAPFTDLTASGFVNLGTGIASEIAERLVENGVRVIGCEDLEDLLRELEMDPSSSADLATAARLLTADLILFGEVRRLDITEGTVGFGLSFSTATVDVELTAQLLDAITLEPAGASITATSQEEGITGFSVGLPSLFGFLNPPTEGDVCSGGLRLGEDVYALTEQAHIGYRNAGSAAWFDLEIATDRGTFVRWLGSRFIQTGACGEWLWDLQGSSGLVEPGLYLARLREGGEIIDESAFWVEPEGEPHAPQADEVTVGSGSFAETIVGRATDNAANQLVSGLIAEIATRAASDPPPEETAVDIPMGQVVVEGQIAQLYADGRVAVNVGRDHGISKWDILEVLEVENVVTDPAGERLLSYDILSSKGELIVVEVSDLGAIAMRVSSFDAAVGDVVRLLQY